jgi:hypothetical protein
MLFFFSDSDFEVNPLRGRKINSPGVDNFRQQEAGKLETERHESYVINTPNTISNPRQQSDYAYVTLMSGIDTTFKYRGFFYNVLIMKRALTQAGSTADFIVLIGFSVKDTSPFEADMNLLRSRGIITYILPRLVDESHDLGFAEMALLKVTPWSFVQYKRVQFFDGDVMPLQNMDCFFKLDKNAFTIGAVSPLNSGWYLAIPDMAAYLYMKRKAIWRLGHDWDKINGWAEQMPTGLTYRGGKQPCLKWEFNGADMDQGLLTHYFILNNGKALLIDTTTKVVREFQTGLLHAADRQVDVNAALDCCGGIVPTQAFAHFTGRSKPWMLDLNDPSKFRKGGDVDKWLRHLDALQLPVNSSNVAQMGLGSPLGFWNANFPKGGFKKKGSRLR